jgi:hypothetical protein
LEPAVSATGSLIDIELKLHQPQYPRDCELAKVAKNLPENKALAPRAQMSREYLR